MKQLRLAFGFFTILPLSRSGGMDEIARAGLWLPAVGAFLGAAEGLLAWSLAELLGINLIAVLALTAALLLTGLHHADGLADVGDAVMAGGGHDRRLAVLKDRTMGIGALMALLLTFIISWASLAGTLPALSPRDWLWLLIAVEVSARMSLITVAMLSRASHKGSGSAFVSGMKGWRGAAALGMSLLLLAAISRPLGIRYPVACGGAALMLGLLLTAGGRRWFGGANGDLLGAAVECGRAAALLGVAAVAFERLTG